MKTKLDAKYLMFEDEHLTHVVKVLAHLSTSMDLKDPKRWLSAVAKGVRLYLEGTRELVYPVGALHLQLTEDMLENDTANKALEIVALTETFEMCRRSEPMTDGRKFDEAQAKWVLMKIYDALCDLHEIDTPLPQDLRERITEERKKTARNRMRLDPSSDSIFF